MPRRAHSPAAGLYSKYGRRYHTRRTGQYWRRHSWYRTPPRRCSPGSANPSEGSLLLPKNKQKGLNLVVENPVQNLYAPKRVFIT